MPPVFDFKADAAAEFEHGRNLSWDEKTEKQFIFNRRAKFDPIAFSGPSRELRASCCSRSDDSERSVLSLRLDDVVHVYAGATVVMHKSVRI